jgi:hypothetical protein
MRDGPSSVTLAGAVGWAPVVSSWLDGRVLADSVPILSGRLSAVASQAVPERLTLTVPEWSDGRSWDPAGDPKHPLAEYGQSLQAAIVVRTSQTESFTRLGVFQVHAPNHDDLGRTVDIEARGPLQRVCEPKFPVPESPRASGTLGSEFRRLMPPGIPVYIDPSLVDRACPASFQWSQDRRAALGDIADAWPARIVTDQWGTVALMAPLADVPVPVLTFTDGEGGTVVSAPRGSTREGRPNQVVATGSSVDSTALDPVRAVAEIDAGPMAVTSDGSGYGTVTFCYSSPLLESTAQARAAARTVLARESAASVVRTVHAAPDPRVELGDAVAVVRGGVTEWGYVVAYELPLTADGGAMRIDVGITA